MSNRAEDDSRRSSIRTFNGGRAGERARVAELARVARALVIAASVAVGLAACGAGGITAPQTSQEPTRNFALTVPTGTSPTDHLIGGDHDDDDGDLTWSYVPFEGVERNCRNDELVPIRGYASFAFYSSADGLKTYQNVQTRYKVDGKGSFGNVYYGGGGHSEVLYVNGLAMSWTIQDKVVLVSKTAPDMYFFMKLYLRIDTDGRPVAFVEKTKTNCEDVAA